MHASKWRRFNTGPARDQTRSAATAPMRTTVNDQPVEIAGDEVAHQVRVRQRVLHRVKDAGSALVTVPEHPTPLLRSSRLLSGMGHVALRCCAPPRT